MRGAWGKKCLESMGGRRIIDRVEAMDGVSAGREIGHWVNGIIAVADVRKVAETDGSTEDHFRQNMNFY